MPIDLTGIKNENEYYTHHYLTAILENDLKDLFAKWKDRSDKEDIKPPHTQLQGLSREYFQLAHQLEKTTDEKEIRDLQYPFFTKLISILGYPNQRSHKEMDTD